MMDMLSGLVDGLDPASLLPDLEMLFAKLVSLARIAVLVGPAALLVLGLLYLFLAPKEANHYLGFRCWWGMSSVEVWRFTQKLAGITWTAMGLIFGVIMLVSGSRYPRMPQEEMLHSAVEAIMWQLAAVVVSILLINLVLIVMFNHRGERRGQKEAAQSGSARAKKSKTKPEAALAQTDETNS